MNTVIDQQPEKSVSDRVATSNLPKRRLLYIDMAYTYEMIKAKKHYEFLESRHSGGYFEKVWGVHPIADVVSGKAARDAGQERAERERQQLVPDHVHTDHRGRGVVVAQDSGGVDSVAEIRSKVAEHLGITL